MSEPIVIRVRCSNLHVTFLHENVLLGREVYSQPTTTCFIRIYRPLRTFVGTSILNPNERYDRMIGERVAFRRAMESILQEAPETFGLAFPVEDREWRAVVKAARCALWEARNAPIQYRNPNFVFVNQQKGS